MGAHIARVGAAHREKPAVPVESGLRGDGQVAALAIAQERLATIGGERKMGTYRRSEPSRSTSVMSGGLTRLGEAPGMTRVEATSGVPEERLQRHVQGRFIKRNQRWEPSSTSFPTPQTS